MSQFSVTSDLESCTSILPGSQKSKVFSRSTRLELQAHGAIYTTEEEIHEANANLAGATKRWMN